MVDWSLHICDSARTQAAKCEAVLLPCIPLISSHDILQKWTIEKGNWPQKSTSEGEKIDNVEAKFESSVGGVL